mgnify:CR=1 FL=1
MNYDKTRWYLLTACIVINICIGFVYAWSVFQKPLMAVQNWDAADVSLAFSIIMGVSALPPAFAGKAMDYIAPKQIILVGGVMLGFGIINLGFVQSLMHMYIAGTMIGIGMGFVYPATVATMVKFFPDRRGLVAGLLAAGMGSGAVIIAPLASILIDSLGVLGTLKALGITFLTVICVLSRLVQTAPDGYRPLGAKIQSSGPIGSSQDKTWQEMLTEPLFYLIAPIFVLGASAGIMVMGHASPIIQKVLGLSPREASVIVGFLALANTFGRVFWGGISDKFGRFPILAVIFVVLGLSLTAMSQASTYIPVVAAMLTIGMCYGGFMGMMASVTADAFGPKHLGVNFGIMFLTIGIASIIGPRMAAVIAQNNHGDYTQAFIIAAAFAVVGVILTSVILLKSRMKYKK